MLLLGRQEEKKRNLFISFNKHLLESCKSSTKFSLVGTKVTKTLILSVSERDRNKGQSFTRKRNFEYVLARNKLIF